MSIQEKISKVTSDLSGVNSWEERYKKIIDMGKNLAAMDEAHKTEANKVRGCQSQVWLHAELEAGKLRFQADSDASIAKGIVALLLAVYDDNEPKEILMTSRNLLKSWGSTTFINESCQWSRFNAQADTNLCYRFSNETRSRNSIMRERPRRNRRLRPFVKWLPRHS